MPAGGSRMIDQFRILREVGRGGMGVVYEAVDELSGRRVALKVLPLTGAEPGLRRRFEKEIHTTAALSHPNIIRVYSVGVVHDQPYYTMEFIDGPSLECFLRLPSVFRSLPPDTSGPPARGTAPDTGGKSPAATAPAGVGAEAATQPSGRPPGEPCGATAGASDRTLLLADAGMPETSPPHPDDACLREQCYYRFVSRVIRDAATGLAHAHDRGIVHRDIKPANILLTREGGVRVSDFGIALELDTARFTRTGVLVGTPRYMSPEQLLKSRVRIDARSDVYSLGSTLYELLTLRPAFEADNREKLLLQIAVQDPQRPRSLNRFLPRDLETIALKAMEKDPDRRYPTAHHLADDLNRFLKGEPILAAPPSMPARALRYARRHPAGTAAVLVAAICLSVGAVAARHLQVSRRDAQIRALVTSAADSDAAGRPDESVAAIRAALALAPDGGELEGLLVTYAGRVERMQAETNRREREREAVTRIGKAQEHLDRYREAVRVLRQAQPLLEQKMRDLHGVFPCLESPDRAVLEAEMQDLRTASAEARREAPVAFSRAAGLLHEALSLAPEAGLPRQALARLYVDALEEAEYRRNPRDVAVYLSLARLYDTGDFAAQLCDAGTVTVTSDPPGASVDLFRYEPEGNHLVPRPAGTLGQTPTPEAAIPHGSCLLVLSLDGYRPVSLPLLVRRGEGARLQVDLYTEAQIGQRMVYVPAGPFLQGWDPDAAWPLPSAVVDLHGFLIGKYEVTCREYMIFLHDLLDTDPAAAEKHVPKMAPTGQVRPWPKDPNGRYGFSGILTPQHPVTGITVEDADAYCRWLALRTGRPYRLPTAVEWERAGRGGDGRFFPWGYEAEPRFANLRYWGNMTVEEGMGTVPVGTYPDDLSPFGVLDMAGNAVEICADDFDRFHNCTVRGGAWYVSFEYGRLTSRYRKHPTTAERALGFRLAADLPQRRPTANRLPEEPTEE